MRISNVSLSLIVAVVVGSACNKSGEVQQSPLGSLGSDQLDDWVADCSTPLVDDRVCGSLAPRADCAAQFHTVDPRGDWISKDADWATTATHRILCKPPGWSIWTDDRGRIIAICADDAPGHPTLGATLRLRDLITEHWNAQTWDMLSKVMSGEDTKHSIVWWTWLQPMVPRVIPSPTGGPPRIVPADPNDMHETRCVEFRLRR